jgi:hypothetical protein
MTGISNVTWRVEPATPPRPHRHCATCGRTRAFQSSGRVRLNANGRKVDAWLIYKCLACERTWNLPLLERVAVSDVPPGDLKAMEASDPGWVKMRAHDTVRLRRYCDRIELTVYRLAPAPPLGGGLSIVSLSLEVSCPTGERLDRLLSRELQWSRAGLLALVRSGVVGVQPDTERTLRKPVASGMVVRFRLDLLAGQMRTDLECALLRQGSSEWAGRETLD